MRASVIATVKNEGSSIDRLLESLCEQTRPADEVIIVDGGSQDNTMRQLQIWEAEQRLPLRVLADPGCNISRGRNQAIAAAQGPVIASTDAGVSLAPDWLESLLKPFSDVESSPPPVACGFFAPDVRTAFETAMGATVLPVVSDVDPQRFLPSSRSVAFLKSAWEHVGGYPEWLDYCEDLVFDLRLRARGYPFTFVPRAIANFRPRGSLSAFFKQYYRYARGDGKADLWRSRHLIRYLTYCVATPAILYLAATEGWHWLIALVVGALSMLWTPYRRLSARLHRLERLEGIKAILWVPIIRLTGDLAKMLGYPAGLFWRWRHRYEIPNWRE